MFRMKQILEKVIYVAEWLLSFNLLSVILTLLIRVNITHNHFVIAANMYHKQTDTNIFIWLNHNWGHREYKRKYNLQERVQVMLTDIFISNFYQFCQEYGISG